jgi:hypothetical protein
MHKILEKHAQKILDSRSSNLQISEVREMLLCFLDDVSDDQIRYDISMSSEMVKSDDGEYVRYDSVHT